MHDYSRHFSETYSRRMIFHVYNRGNNGLDPDPVNEEITEILSLFMLLLLAET